MNLIRGTCISCGVHCLLSLCFERIFRPVEHTRTGTYSRGPFCQKCVLLAGGALFTITADDMDLEVEDFPELHSHIFRPLFEQTFVEVNYGEGGR